MEYGKLISLEGIDGVGKTLCAIKLCDLLSSSQKYVYVNRKSIPTNNEYVKLHMEYLYAILWGKGEVFSRAPNIAYNGLPPDHWRYLMLAWYSVFEQYVIFPKLECGVNVITDGYFYKEMVKAIYSSGSFDTETQFDGLYKPDIVFYLTAQPSECMRDDSNRNRVESGAFVGLQSDFVKLQTEMKHIYDKLAKDRKWAIINRDADVNITCRKIVNAFDSITRDSKHFE